MSSRFRRHAVSLLAVAALLFAASCEREERESRATPVPDNGPGLDSITLSDLYAGAPSPPQPDPRRADYEKNAFHLSEGKRLFTWFNCNGCHSNGGGGMGPALMDDTWIYGSEIENIFATIVQGRPNGMPSFRNKIPEQQIWELAGYVRSLSGQTPKAASPSRSDRMQVKPAEQSMPQAAPKTAIDEPPTAGKP